MQDFFHTSQKTDRYCSQITLIQQWVTFREITENSGCHVECSSRWLIAIERNYGTFHKELPATFAATMKFKPRIERHLIIERRGN